MRGSQASRSSTITTMAAASQRSIGSGRASEIQAIPATMKASATVSQPFSNASVSASASAATAPVAKIACAAALPGRVSRRVSTSVATANSAASSNAKAANGMERSNPAMR